tara:strand:+ start:277 stop:675 length:399 start_codon:yes stop_codon:yes gene_type:complete
MKRQADSDTEITQRFELLEPFLDERLRRLAAAAEAQCLGTRSVSAVSRATSVSRRAISQGLRELKESGPSSNSRRIRKPGGGRKRTVDTDQYAAGKFGASCGARNARRPGVSIAMDLQKFAPAVRRIMSARS